MMPRYLLTLSLGPVQSMIGAARRTRDLWCGSWLLSEVSRAAALVLHESNPGCLIFPAPEHPDRDLQPLQRPGDEANIANILRAELEAASHAELRELCRIARDAAQQRLLAMGEVAREGIAAQLNYPLWEIQLGDTLEVFSAWTLIGEDGYGAASAKLGGVLAARKATRDCGPAQGNGIGLPKSSLDGGFETVLPKARQLRHSDTRKLALSKGEQLDALGVIKRRSGDVDQFTAYSRIAADPWLQRLDTEVLAELRRSYEPLVGLGLATRVSGNQGVYADFPYDGQLLFDFRLENQLVDDTLSTEERAALRQLQKALRPIWSDYGTPVPYAVILQADGDRMGELLSRAESASASRDISRALQGFANDVREIVRRHRGHAVYAGGDDVLALLPLPGAKPCAAELAECFGRSLGAIGQKLSVPASAMPSLSAGLGIGHLVQPLGTLRARALQAEKYAKGDELPEAQRRNALAVVLGVRSGRDIHWRAQWNDPEAGQFLDKMVDAYQQKLLPSRVAYDLRAIDLRLAWLRGQDDETARGMREAEVLRMFDRARVEGGSAPISGALRADLLRRARTEPLGELADTLIIARWLSARSAADVEGR